MANNEGKILAVNKDGTKVRLPSSQDEFLVMERMADQEIVDQLRGKLLPAYVYSFKSPNGDQVVDLTKDGVFAFANLKKGIRLDREWDNFKETEAEEFMCIYRAEDVNTGDTREGSATQPKFDHKGVKDPYAFAKCTSKGQRNALRHILNVDAWRQLILIFLEDEAVQKLKMVKLSIEQNLLKFGYEIEQLNSYINSEYGVSSIDDESVSQETGETILDENTLKKINAFVISSDGVEFFKRPKSLASIDNFIINHNLDRVRIDEYVKEIKGVGIDELNSESLGNLKEYLSNNDLSKFLNVTEIKEN